MKTLIMGLKLISDRCSVKFWMLPPKKKGKGAHNLLGVNLSKGNLG